MAGKRRLVFVAIGFAALATACWERHAERNEERAYFAQEGLLYRVEMKGQRLPLVHDPISLLLSRTDEETFTMSLPRIEGTIEGSEIQHAGTVRYLGRVVITNGSMKVDLYLRDEGRQRPLSWNDDYTLVQKGTVRIP